MLCCSSAPRVAQRRGVRLSSGMAAACRSGDAEEVRRRLGKGERANAPGVGAELLGGMTALMIAAFHGHEKCVKVCPLPRSTHTRWQQW